MESLSCRHTFTTSVELDRYPLIVVLGQVEDVLLLGPLAALAVAALSRALVLVVAVVMTSSAPAAAVSTTATSATTASSEVASSSAAAAMPSTAVCHRFSGGVFLIFVSCKGWVERWGWEIGL